MNAVWERRVEALSEAFGDDEFVWDIGEWC